MTLEEFQRAVEVEEKALAEVEANGRETAYRAAREKKRTAQRGLCFKEG